MSLCERERESVCVRERERECVCVCVCERERERVCVCGLMFMCGSLAERKASVSRVRVVNHDQFDL